MEFGGLLRTITDTQARTVSFAYTDAHNPTQPSAITDTSLNRTVTLTYDGVLGAVSAITDATGSTTGLGYGGGNLTAITDANSHQTALGYATGRVLTSWTYGAGSADAAGWSAAYPTATSTTVTDPNNHTATYAIAGSTTTAITDANGHPTSSAWDGHDNLTSRTDGMANQTQYAYGGAGNPNNMLSKWPAGSRSSGSTRCGTGR